MKALKAFSSHNAEKILEEKNKLDGILKVLDDTTISIYDHDHKDLKKIIIEKFIMEGWGTRVRVFYDLSNYLDLILDKIVIHVQFGHRAQVYFDLLKLSTLKAKNKIDLGVLIIPSKEYAFGNRTDVETFIKHNEEFSNFLDVPLLILEIY